VQEDAKNSTSRPLAVTIVLTLRAPEPVCCSIGVGKQTVGSFGAEVGLPLDDLGTTIFFQVVSAGTNEAASF
jgi:hypothetical protein